MTRWLVALGFLGAIELISVDSFSARATVSGYIEVRDGGLRTEVVLVRAVSSERNEIHVVAAAQNGEFSMAGLEPGRWSLSADTSDFVQVDPRTRLPCTFVIVLTDRSAITGLRLVLERGAVLGGQVHADNGHPADGVSVLLYRVKGHGEAATLGAGVTSTVTNERGYYRFAGLAAGRYALAARWSSLVSQGVTLPATGEIDWAMAQLRRPSVAPVGPASVPPSAAANPEMATTVFFPGTTALVQSGIVAVSSGEVSLDKNISFQRVPALSLAGSVLDINGRRTGVSQAILISEQEAASSPLLKRIRVETDGTFSLSDLPPGDYRVSVRATVGNELHWGTADVSLRHSDITDLRVQLQPAARIHGLVVVEGPSGVRPVKNGRIRFSAARSRLNAAGINEWSAITRADGTFEIDGVNPGLYWIDVAGSTNSNALVTRVQAPGTSLSDRLVAVRASETVTLRVTTAELPAELEGTLRYPASHDPTSYALLAFPVAPELRARRSGRLRLSPVAADGSFRLTGLAGGEYYLAAVLATDQETVFEPSVLELVAAHAIRVIIRDGERRRMDLAVVGG